MQNDDIQQVITKIDEENEKNSRANDEAEKRLAEIDLEYAEAIISGDVEILETIQKNQKEA